MNEFLTPEGIKLYEVVKQHNLDNYYCLMSGTIAVSLDELTPEIKLNMFNLLISLNPADNYKIVVENECICLGNIE